MPPWAYSTSSADSQVLISWYGRGKWKKVKSLSRVWIFATQWTAAHQTPPSMGFSRQEYWSGLPFPSPGNLPDPGIKLGSPALQAGALLSEPPGASGGGVGRGKRCDWERDTEGTREVILSDAIWVELILSLFIKNWMGCARLKALGRVLVYDVDLEIIKI